MIFRSRLSHFLIIFMLIAASIADAQIATTGPTPISLPGLVTNILTMPTAPTNLQKFNCGAGSTSYSYEVAAQDFAGGFTNIGTTTPTP